MSRRSSCTHHPVEGDHCLTPARLIHRLPRHAGSTMDPALYKTTTTTRGLTYRYWCAPARAGQPTLLLCHGFPCTAHDWRHVAPRLAARGLGVLAPDMLGYGGTDAPADPAAYVFSRMTRDLVDILDAERVPRAIAVGHDWCAARFPCARACRPC